MVDSLWPRFTSENDTQQRTTVHTGKAFKQYTTLTGSHGITLAPSPTRLLVYVFIPHAPADGHRRQDNSSPIPNAHLTTKQFTHAPHLNSTRH